MQKRTRTVKEIFHDKNIIDFLQWAELDVVECQEKLGIDPSIQRVFISPDVHSLHIVWLESNGLICHEIADWPESNVVMADFLANEIGDDSQETIGKGSIEDIIPDFKEEVIRLRLARLGI